MRKGAFLDCDGVIWHNDRSMVGGNYYNLSIADVRWIEGAIQAHERLYQAGYDIFWVTMQNCIREGKIKADECYDIFKFMRNYINNLLGNNVVRDFAICSTEEKAEAKVLAKRNAILGLATLNMINLSQSFGCGDARSDILAYNEAGIGTTVHIDLPDTTVQNDHDVKEADGIAPNLETAVQWLLARGNEIDSLFIDTVNKLTGREYVMLNDPSLNQCYKLLQIFKGRQSSYHCHHIKTETFTIVKGAVKLQIGDEVIHAIAGRTFQIDPECYHSFSAETETAIIFEESSYHDDKDTIRKNNSCATEEN